MATKRKVDRFFEKADDFPNRPEQEVPDERVKEDANRSSQSTKLENANHGDRADASDREDEYRRLKAASGASFRLYFSSHEKPIVDGACFLFVSKKRISWLVMSHSDFRTFQKLKT
ncbi:MAG: hypothetical protein ACI87E_003642 [Mariniblastus sp.]